LHFEIWEQISKQPTVLSILKPHESQSGTERYGWLAIHYESTHFPCAQLPNVTLHSLAIACKWCLDKSRASWTSLLHHRTWAQAKATLREPSLSAATFLSLLWSATVTCSRWRLSSMTRRRIPWASIWKRSDLIFLQESNRYWQSLFI